MHRPLLAAAGAQDDDTSNDGILDNMDDGIMDNSDDGIMDDGIMVGATWPGSLHGCTPPHLARLVQPSLLPVAISMPPHPTPLQLWPPADDAG